MRSANRLALSLTLALVPFWGCSRSEPEPSAPAQTPPPAVQQTEPAPAKTAEVPPVSRPADPPVVAKPAETAPPPPPPVEKPAVPTAPAQATPPDVTVLKATLGGVRFQHKDHAVTRKIPCGTCHHPSRPEKPATAPQQACGACHTSTAVAPMKTKLQAAFHNPAATAGTCIDCHKAEGAKGSKAPVKCLDCHKKGTGE